MTKRIANALLALSLIAGACAYAQQSAQPGATPPAQSQQRPNAGAADNANTPSQELARTSETAAEGDETAGFKHSPVVRWISSHLGISTEAGYWVLYTLDFAIIAFLIAWAWQKNIPSAFRARTASIRKTMDEAQTASADANRRLSEIEARLSRLDKEIADMAAAAETEAAAEEARIHAAAEQEAQRIVEGAQAEIESASRLARRELKAYAADLAVSLAEKRIQVDPGTDQQLVQNFSRELGAGKGGS